MNKTILHCKVCNREFETTHPAQIYCDDICRKKNRDDNYVDKRERVTRQLNNKQIAYLTARIQGKSKEESKRIAQYGANTPTSVIESSPNLRSALLSCMEKNGLTEQFLADKLKQGLEATKIQYFSKDGMVVDERVNPDHDIQHKYFTKALEIRGDIKSNAIETLNLGIVQLPTIKSEEEWNEDVKDVSTPNTDNESIDGK